MKQSSRNTLLTALLASLTLGVAGVATAQSDSGSAAGGGTLQGGANTTRTGAAAGTPGLSTDSPDAVFDRLDRSKRGYLTREDVSSLQGFQGRWDAQGRMNREAFGEAYKMFKPQ